MLNKDKCQHFWDNIHALVLMHSHKEQARISRVGLQMVSELGTASNFQWTDSSDQLEQKMNKLSKFQTLDLPDLPS